MLKKPVQRRQFVQQSAVAVIGAALSPMLLAQTANPPSSAFSAESTAEKVTAGIDLSGLTAVVTGANSGLGMETARVLALRGAHVFCTARSLEKARAACEEIEGKTTPLVLELTDFESITACSKAIQAATDKIDILVCNAGIMQTPELSLFNGVEKQFAVNHLGHFLFSNQLMPQVKAADQGRFVIVSSWGYNWAPEVGIDFDNLDGANGYDPTIFYGQSKAANHLFALSLSEQLKGTTTTANSLHPGIINTNLGRDFVWWKRIAANVIGWTFMKSIPEGAATSAYVSTAPALADVSGVYFEDCNPVAPDKAFMNDKALADKLWQVSADLCKGYMPS